MSGSEAKVGGVGGIVSLRVPSEGSVNCFGRRLILLINIKVFSLKQYCELPWIAYAPWSWINSRVRQFNELPANKILTEYLQSY